MSVWCSLFGANILTLFHGPLASCVHSLNFSHCFLFVFSLRGVRFERFVDVDVFIDPWERLV